jgi:hypothetical protein
VKRDAAQDPRGGIHPSGVSARRLGACAAQRLFVKPGLVADLHVIAIGIEHIGRVIAGIPLRPAALARTFSRSSELSGPTLVNTSNVVLKARVMAEWRKIFEAEDSDFGGGT